MSSEDFEVQKAFDPVPEVPYDQLDPGIRKTVRWFNDNGFVTSDSGDGISKMSTPAEDCMMAPGLPNVVIEVDPEDMVASADTVLEMILSKGVRVGPDEATVTVFAGPQPEGTEYGDGVFIQASYDPTRASTAIILVTGLDDALLERV